MVVVNLRKVNVYCLFVCLFVCLFGGGGCGGGGVIVVIVVIVAVIWYWLLLLLLLLSSSSLSLLLLLLLLEGHVHANVAFIHAAGFVVAAWFAYFLKETSAIAIALLLLL